MKAVTLFSGTSREMSAAPECAVVEIEVAHADLGLSSSTGGVSRRTEGRITCTTGWQRVVGFPPGQSFLRNRLRARMLSASTVSVIQRRASPSEPCQSL